MAVFTSTEAEVAKAPTSVTSTTAEVEEGNASQGGSPPASSSSSAQVPTTNDEETGGLLAVTGADWPVIQPPEKRRSRFFCCGDWLGCCPAFFLISPILGTACFIFGSVGVALVIGLAAAFYACLGCPLWVSYCVCYLWRCKPFEWKTDWYTKFMFLSTQGMQFSRQVPKQEEMCVKWMPTSDIKPKRPLKKHLLDYALHIQVPSLLEEEWVVDAVPPNPVMLWFEERMSKKLPFWDHMDGFAKGEDPVAYVMRQLGHVYPAIYQDWSDKRSDMALTRFCKEGLGAHRIETVDEGGERFYVVRTNMLSPLPVRKGFARYGGDVYFDKNWRPVKIIDDGVQEPKLDGTDQGVVTRPGDARWEEAKFRFRSSLSVLVTVVDHLYGVHLQAANVMVTAYREQLSADHPMRRFLAPFTFQTISVNDHARNNLTQPGSMGPRCFALTDLGFRLAFAAAPHIQRFGQEVPAEDGGPYLNRAAYTDYLRERHGIDTEYHRQCKKYWLICRQFVKEYMDHYYADPAAVRADEELCSMFREFYFLHEGTSPFERHMKMRSALLRFTDEQLAEVVADEFANFMFLVTVGHEQVGAVEVYVQDVSFCSFKWTPGSLCGTKQTATAQALLMSFTSAPMPKLLGADWTHLFLPRQVPAKEGAKYPKDAFRDFQAALASMADESDAYNNAASSRPFPECFPMYVCNPRILETGVSV